MDKTVWQGKKVCDICWADLSEEMLFDARTRGGQWGVLCSECFETHGIGLGVGKGQQYRPEYLPYSEHQLEESPTHVKIAG